MDHRTSSLLPLRCIVPLLLLICSIVPIQAALRVDTSFPGGSAMVTSIDAGSRIIRIKPAEHPGRGWPCWWYLRVEGTQPGKPLTLVVKGMSFALPDRAAVSADNITWTHTRKGQRVKGDMVYQINPTTSSVWLAWGPPFQWKDARALVSRLADEHPTIDAFELCRSREGRSVPALRFRPTDAASIEEVRSVWVQARQHAWESGSSWVSKGLAEWLASDDPASIQLRRRTEVVLVPIMDLDNVERGAGGKDQKPHDHNRDWSARPQWPEVEAAQSHMRRWDAGGRMTVFIDLHNPGPKDLESFFFSATDTVLSPVNQRAHARFLKAARMRMGEGPLAFKGMVRGTGPAYHPMWQHISGVWVSQTMEPPVVSLCLETSWNTPASQVAGYEAVGASLGRTLSLYFQEVEVSP